MRISKLFAATFAPLAMVAGVVTTQPAQGQTTLRVLYTFRGAPDAANSNSGLIRDGLGNFYGTTYLGGIGTDCTPLGCGTVYKIDLTGKETVLHSFTGGSDGLNHRSSQRSAATRS